jgi:hypothetical protein
MWECLFNDDFRTNATYAPLAMRQIRYAFQTFFSRNDTRIMSKGGGGQVSMPLMTGLFFFFLKILDDA